MKKNWEVKKLGEVCELISGQHIESKNYNTQSKGIGYLTGPSDFGSLHPIVSKWTEYPKVTAHKDDILITVKGSGIGKINLLHIDEVAISRQLMAIRTNKAETNFIYAFLVLQYNFFQSLGNGAAIPGISRKDVLNLKCPIPPLSEQQRIVSILEETFAAIEKAKENAEKNLQNSRELFDSYLQSLDAEKESLGSLVDITTGKLNANAATENGQYPFFTCSRDIFSIDKFAFDCEAILLAGNNAVGDFNVKHYKGKFNAYQRTYVITVNKENRVLYRYLYFQMLNSLKEFKMKSVGAGTKFLKLGMIKDLKIALPSLSEQTSIVAKLDALSAETKKLEAIYQQKLAALDELKKAVLKKAFDGELTGA